LFSFAQRIYQILSQLLVGVMNSVSFPLLSSLKNEEDKLRKVFTSITFISSAASFPIFVGLAAVADDLIPWAFGPHWIDAVWPLRGFCVLGTLACIGVLQSALIQSKGKVNWWTWYMAANQTLSVAVVIAFYKYGVNILVGVMAVKTCMFWPISVAMTVRLLRIGLLQYLRPFALPSAASLAMILCVLATHHLLADSEIAIRLGAQLAAGAITYISVLFFFGKNAIAELIGFVKQSKSQKRQA
jgi:O-antigen/teichoic acid export membrane protein